LPCILSIRKRLGVEEPERDRIMSEEKSTKQECDLEAVDLLEESEDLREPSEPLSYKERILKELNDYTYAYIWAKDKYAVQEGMREFVKEFVPVHKQVEFAGSDIGIFNGCMVELTSLGNPGVYFVGDYEPIFKAVKKCSWLYHEGRPVPTKLFMVNLGTQWVCQYDLALFADVIKKEYDSGDRSGDLGDLYSKGEVYQYSYSDPKDRKKLFNELNNRNNKQCLEL